MSIKLFDYAYVVLNSSAGKDSQTMVDVMVREADAQGYSRDRMVVAHADLGRMEWPGTPELAREQADAYGLRFWKESRRQGDILDQVRHRQKWPDSARRFCTSDHKRAQVAKLFTQLSKEVAGKNRHQVLNVFGFRAAESPARAKRQVFTENKRLTTKSRTVVDYLPIHHWSEKEVWERIRESKVRYHWAYDIGMPRLSCSFCIFAPRQALMLAGKHRPDLLKEYVDLEAEIGHDFQEGKPIRKIREALDRGEEPDLSGDDGTWNM